MSAGAPGRRFPDPGRPPGEEIADLVHVVALRLQADSDAITADMSMAIEAMVEDLSDPEMTDLLHASVAGNVEVILGMLLDGTLAQQIPPVTAAVRYAVRLAQSDVAESSLRRAYHVGSEQLLAHTLHEVQQLPCDPELRLLLFHHLASWLHQYVDGITGVVIAAYEEERRSSNDRDAATTALHISRVLGQQNVDSREFARATGHRLDQEHVGSLLWIEGVDTVTDHSSVLARFAASLAEAVGSSAAPLVVGIDRHSARAWFGRAQHRPPVDVSAVRTDLGQAGVLHVAFGAPRHGVEGFRTTLLQAERVATIARVSTAPHSRAVSYADEGMAVVARLAENVGFARRWVREVLGPLAENSEHAQRQRETVSVFLEANGSYTKAADQLTMHRNSIRYRIRQAERELDRALTENTLDTRLALRLCHVLGSTVLGWDESELG